MDAKGLVILKGAADLQEGVLEEDEGK